MKLFSFCSVFRDGKITRIGSAPMIIIVCLDKKQGMMFGDRRQSKDRTLRQRILQMCEGKKLWMNGYSYKQFQEDSGNISVAEDFLDKAGEGEYCFVENVELKPYLKKIEQIIVYHWNRQYPSDQKIDIDLKKWKRKSIEDFQGNSHKKITEEVLEP